MFSMEDCIFCKIVAKQIPCKLIFEDVEVMAFHDIAPAAPVHVLLIPKQHLASLSDVQAEHQALLGKMLMLAPKLAAELGCGFDAASNTGGYKTLFNTGPDGGQEVHHLHMHIMGGPRPWRGHR
jgi:histidine triad (HIT) family protein